MNTAMTTSYKKSAATGKLFNTSSSLQERSEGRRWEEDCIAVWHHHDTWGEQYIRTRTRTSQSINWGEVEGCRPGVSARWENIRCQVACLTETGVTITCYHVTVYSDVIWWCMLGNYIQLNVIRWFLSGLHDKQSCRLTQLTLWCSHATRPLSHGENHIYSWWWCEKRKLTARRQSGVCSVALSLISASVSHSVALWSFRVVPNTKLLRRYVDTKWWMDKIPRYLVGFDLLTQTETQVHQNITENHFISPDFLKNIWYWSNTVIGSLPQQQTSSRTRRDGGILHN